MASIEEKVKERILLDKQIEILKLAQYEIDRELQFDLMEKDSKGYIDTFVVEGDSYTVGLKKIPNRSGTFDQTQLHSLKEMLPTDVLKKVFKDRWEETVTHPESWDGKQLAVLERKDGNGEIGRTIKNARFEEAFRMEYKRVI